MIERLRSLPIYQPAVLIGRTVSDLCRNVFTFLSARTFTSADTR